MTEPFNTLMHDLVPEHHLLSDAEAEKVLNELGITRDQLPKIKDTDAAIQVLSRAIEKEIPEGSIIKVVRKSETAGISIAYRLVTEG